MKGTLDLQQGGVGFLGGGGLHLRATADLVDGSQESLLRILGCAEAATGEPVARQKGKLNANRGQAYR